MWQIKRQLSLTGGVGLQIPVVVSTILAIIYHWQWVLNSEIMEVYFSSLNWHPACSNFTLATSLTMEPFRWDLHGVKLTVSLMMDPFHCDLQGVKLAISLIIERFNWDFHDGTVPSWEKIFIRIHPGIAAGTSHTQSENHTWGPANMSTYQ